MIIRFAQPKLPIMRLSKNLWTLKLISVVEAFNIVFFKVSLISELVIEQFPIRVIIEMFSGFIVSFCSQQFLHSFYLKTLYLFVCYLSCSEDMIF